MEEVCGCDDMGYKFIREIVEFSNLRKTIEEVFHFANIAFEYQFGASAIMFIYKRYNGVERIEISRGFSNEFVKAANETPPKVLLNELNAAKKSIYVDFSKEKDKYKDYENLFEHKAVKEFYASELISGSADSYFVIMYSTQGFKNCGKEVKGIFDTIFSVISYILNSNKCIQNMKECSQIDYVSGLNNFKHFHEKLFQEMQKTSTGNEKFSIALISLNQLNKVNSIFGHNVGDRDIAIIANIIKKHIRTFDTAARYGNKFIILFPNIDKRLANEIVKTILSEVEEIFRAENQDMISLNGGISSYPEDGNTERTILDIAESRRIEARRIGKWSLINQL